MADKTKVSLYKALIKPHLEYWVQLLSLMFKKKKKSSKMERAQRRTTKTIEGMEFFLTRGLRSLVCLAQ